MHGQSQHCALLTCAWWISQAVRTSHDLLISRRGEVVLHNHDSKESSSSSDDTSSGPAGGIAAGDERAAAAIAEEVQHNRKLLASKGCACSKVVQ